MDPRASSFALLLALALGVGCVTTVQDQPPRLNDRDVAQAQARRSWLVQAPAGPALGSVVHLQSSDESGRYFYAVRNLYSQDLGLVDALGRAFRHRPHQSEPELLGSGTVAEGAARILQGGGTVELIEIRMADLELRLAQELRRKTSARQSAGRTPR